MKNNKLPAIAVLMAPVLMTACSLTSGGNVADKPHHNSAKPALTADDLANAIYHLDSLGEFRLDKGEFNRKYGEGSTQRHKVTLEKVAFGDLDQDGLGDAAVILAWQTGGSGTFKYLIAMRNTGNASRQLDSVLLGDRAQIRSLSIADDQVRLETLQSGPSDPACCPSRQVQLAYGLHDGKWVQGADKTAPSNADLTGVVWKWERYEDTFHPRHFVIDDPDKYTLILLPNGTYRVKADCNRMQGQYTVEGKSIKIVPGAATLAECEPGSRYLEYLKDLTAAVSFVLRDDKLVLNLVMGGESLVFGNGGPVSSNPRY